MRSLISPYDLAARVRGSLSKERRAASRVRHDPRLGLRQERPVVSHKVSQARCGFGRSTAAAFEASEDDQMMSIVP